MTSRKKQVPKRDHRRQQNLRELAQREKRKSRALTSSSESFLRIDEPEGGQVELPSGTISSSEMGGTLKLGNRPAPRTPEPTSREESALDRWWGEFEAADGPTRLAMTRDKLDSVAPDDEDFPSYFPEVIFELEPRLPGEPFVSFLEELHEVRHDVFLLGNDWFTRSMVYEYLAQGRSDDIDKVITRLSKTLTKVDSPLFSLLSTLRLAGHTDAGDQLLDAAVRQLDHSSLTPWAVNDLLTWAIYRLFRNCVAAGADDAALATMYQAAAELPDVNSEDRQADWRERVLHLCGRAEKTWVATELISGKQREDHKIQLLCMDFQHWLNAERGIAPIVADELTVLTLGAIGGIETPFNRLLHGLTRHEIEPYLADKLGFMSLHQIHAPATIVAMKHFYDFLDQAELVKPAAREKVHAVCDALWAEIQTSFGETWPNCRFLESYMSG